MNVKFKTLDIENFRSITKAHIDLENQGVVVVKGINEYEDNATSNGSGKSSIFEAIVYTIFEETSIGDKNVENRIIGNGFNLALTFTIDNINYKINRKLVDKKSSVEFYKGDENISARNKTDTNKLILSTLNINKSIFLDSIFLSQGVSTNLTSLQPTARKERLEILTNTDLTINNFKEQVKALQIQYESQSIDITKLINFNEGTKVTLESQLLELNNKFNNLLAEQKRKESLGNIEDIDNKIKDKEICIVDFKTTIEYVDNEIKSTEVEHEKLNKELSELSKKLSPYDDKLEEKRELYTKTNNNIIIEDSNITQILKENERLQLEIIQIKNSDKCPTCGRKYDDINEKHIQNTINEKIKMIEDNEVKRKDTENRKSQLLIELDNIRQDGQKIKDEKQKILEDNIELENKFQEKSKKIKELSLQKDNLYNNIQLVQNEITQLNNLKTEILKINTDGIEELNTEITMKNIQLTKIIQEITNLNEQYKNINIKIETIKHVIQLITKEFRTYLLKSSVNYLNKLLLDYSKQLFSNVGDIIKINSEDTKLNINLGSSSYESLSGGEKTRVDIALLLAQKSLASVIGNITYNIIILDEILGYCDSQAEVNILNLVMNELNTLESIYMVSHKELPIPYDTQLIIIKNKQGLSTIKEF